MKRTEHYYVVKGSVEYDEHGAFRKLNFDIDHAVCDGLFQGKSIYVPSENVWISTNQPPTNIAHDDDLITSSLSYALEQIEQQEVSHA